LQRAKVHGGRRLPVARVWRASSRERPRCGFYDLSPGKGEVLPLPPPRGKQADKEDAEGDEDADGEDENVE